MPINRNRNRDELPAVRVYTVCDESKYLIVRNVPALGCGEELSKLFATYGDIQECKPMDAEDCDLFTDVYWINFRLLTNARFAKRKLDDSVFLGNLIQVSYAPQFEALDDTKDKLECRRKQVLARLNPARSSGLIVNNPGASSESLSMGYTPQTTSVSEHINPNQTWGFGNADYRSHLKNAAITTVSSDQDYFASQTMNQTVRSVRDKLYKIHSSSEHLQAGVAAKKPRVDNRRRI